MKMNNLFRLLLTGALAALLACSEGGGVDEEQPTPGTEQPGQKPEEKPDEKPDDPVPPAWPPTGSLESYVGLKEYVNRTTDPDFKVAAGIDVPTFNQRGFLYDLAKENFNELTAGNAMKFASCVHGNEGRMDFSTVRRFVETAREAGITIYGHTLAWHSQQNTAYLNGLLADRVDPNYTPQYEEVAGTCIRVDAGAMTEAAWDSQFWMVFPETAFKEGDKWEVSLSVMAEKEAAIGTQVHTTPGNYIHYSAIGTVPFKTRWTTYRQSGRIGSEQAGGASIAFNLNDFSAANTYYFDNLSFKLNGKELIANGNCDDPNGTANFRTKENRGAIEPSRIVDRYTIDKGSGGKIALTAAEKKEALQQAMARWVDGMMEACGGYVTTWDVVNEAISGGNPDSEGVFALQHDNGDASNFFWQDYLGDIDYVRTAVVCARNSFAKYGGDPSKLKLFINDYNLESDWDQNGKVKSLIAWIKRWEADGVTKVDGIGTQMHISCYEDENTQRSKEAAVERMFRLMAATGKLVKITELDMGYVKRGSWEGVKGEALTAAQHERMAEYYRFIIRKYFEIVPAAQRYGVTQWAMTDSPAGSGWRAGEPIGLWTQDYKRKPAYAGFADGLGIGSGLIQP